MYGLRSPAMFRFLGREGVSSSTLEMTELLPVVFEIAPLSEILGALSHALDLTEGQPVGHCMRSCWIAVHVGHVLGLVTSFQARQSCIEGIWRFGCALWLDRKRSQRLPGAGSWDKVHKCAPSA